MALMGGMPMWGVRQPPPWASYRYPRAHLYGPADTADRPWVRHRAICGIGSNLLYEYGQGQFAVRWVAPLDLRDQSVRDARGKPVKPCSYCLACARRMALA